LGGLARARLYSLRALTPAESGQHTPCLLSRAKERLYS
jgi:hypothetical protein